MPFQENANVPTVGIPIPNPVIHCNHVCIRCNQVFRESCSFMRIGLLWDVSHCYTSTMCHECWIVTHSFTCVTCRRLLWCDCTGEIEIRQHPLCLSCQQAEGAYEEVPFEAPTIIFDDEFYPRDYEQEDHQESDFEFVERMRQQDTYGNPEHYAHLGTVAERRVRNGEQEATED